MSAIPHPQRIHSVHVESIDGELCVYDTARQRVHALNHTAAFVWQRCDGRTRRWNWPRPSPPRRRSTTPRRSCA